MTEIYLAYSHRGGTSMAAWDWVARPLNVLVAYPFVPSYRALLARAPHVAPARTILDSGAFSVWRSGESIDIQALTAETLRPEWSESVVLDVIGSAEGSRNNADYMRAAGSPAWPVFHVGEPWELLDHYVKGWPKVGLSCRTGKSPTETLRFYSMCFARHWPHRYHSFGCLRESVLAQLPFHSADASSWSYAACAFRDMTHHGRRVKGLGKGVSVGAVDRYLEVEIEHVLNLQQRLRAQWRSELEKLP